MGTGLALLSGLKTTSNRRNSSGGMSGASAGCRQLRRLHCESGFHVTISPLKARAAYSS